MTELLSVEQRHRDAFGVPTNLDALATDVWQDFLDANPSDVNSPEEYPNHALVSYDEFVAMAQTLFISAQPLPPMPGDSDAARQLIADHITACTDDGVWSFEVWEAWQRVFAALPPTQGVVEALREIAGSKFLAKGKNWPDTVSLMQASARAALASIGEEVA